MGTLKQLRPMRSSPLLQQAIFWPLPHLAPLSWPEMSTFLLPSEAPDWGAAKATAATEAMRKDLKKAILMIVGFGGKGWEASVVLLIGLK